MPRRTILNIIEDILNILSKEGELSIRQISVKTVSKQER